MCVCVSGVCADMPLSHIRPNGLCNMCLMRQLPRHLQAYIRPKAKGKELLMVTRVTVFVFGIVTGPGLHPLQCGAISSMHSCLPAD